MTKKKQKLSPLVSLAEKAKKKIWPLVNLVKYGQEKQKLSPLVTLAKISQDYFFENEWNSHGPSLRVAYQHR